MNYAYFPGFHLHARQILRFAQSDTLFSLLLVDYSVVHYEARREDIERFREWLLNNGAADAKR